MIYMTLNTNYGKMQIKTDQMKLETINILKKIKKQTEEVERTEGITEALLTR